MLNIIVNFVTVYTFRWAKINLFLFVIIEQTDNNRRPGNRRLKGSLPKRFGQITRQIPVVFFLKRFGGIQIPEFQRSLHLEHDERKIPLRRGVAGAFGFKHRGQYPGAQAQCGDAHARRK